MSGLKKNVSSFLEEVGIDSDEHKKHLEKLTRVLEEMKGSANSAERKYYVSFKQTVDAFDQYLSEKKVKLTDREKERFAVIAGSGLNNMAKKRMAEDLIHQIKDRISGDLELRAEGAKKKEDIAALKKTGFWLIDWYNLTKFALEFGTITVFSHRYRAESFDVIRLKAASAHKEISSELKGILDSYYYYLSILEYNALLKLYETGKSLEKLASIKRNLSYHPMEIFEFMNDFAAAYISVMRNLNSIESGLKKIFKDRQPGHGFMGYVGFLVDRQVYNSRTVKHNEREMITGTITGSLYSYYTAYMKVKVRTFNQLMYIVSEEGVLNNSEKEYTPEARIFIETESSQVVTEGARIKSKLSELVNITGKYSEAGKALAKKLFETEARGSLQVWIKETNIKPFFRIMKIFDAYLKYILELIISRDSFDLEYDSRIINGYLNGFPELIKAAEDYRSFSLELQGARGKDLQNYKHSEDVDKDDFLKRLMEQENIILIPGEMKQIRETLGVISARSYNICMRINDVINRYINTGKIESKDVTQNYNFIINAKVLHPKVRHLENMLNKKEVFLIDFFEAACSVAEYLSETLMNTGIKAISDEVDRLKKEVEKYDLSSSSPAEMENPDDDSGEEELESTIDKIYIDTLTGYKKWEYFEDFILPEVYDEDGNYQGDAQRHVFCAELSNFVEINRQCGKDAGDKVYKRLSEIVNDTLNSAGSGNIAMRSKGGLIIGYINGITAVEAVDLLFKMLYLVKEFSLSSDIKSLPDLIFNAGIYTEKKRTNSIMNIETARRIMFQGADGKTGHVAFLRNSDQIVEDKDFDRRGRLKEGLVSVIS